MDIDEDTDWWLGSPTPLEMCQQHALLLENEIQELYLQLRKAREDIHGLTQMHATASRERDELRSKLKAATAKLNSTDLELQFALSKLNSLQWSVQRARGGAWGSQPDERLAEIDTRPITKEDLKCAVDSPNTAESTTSPRR